MTTICTVSPDKTYQNETNTDFKFSGPLTTTVGAFNAKTKKFAYRWVNAATRAKRVAYFVDVPGMELVEGTTYRAARLVETPAPPPAPATNVRTGTFTSEVGGIEAFLLTDFVTLGVGRLGSLGTAGRLPAGVPTDADRGFLRAGIFCHATKPLMGDAVLYGRSVEGFVVAHRASTLR